jgi:hypothetical protein
MSAIVTQLTEWYPGSIKPVRPGVYERKYSFYRASCAPLSKSYYSRFDGTCWYAGLRTSELGAVCYFRSADQDLPWRGLNARPTN